VWAAIPQCVMHYNTAIAKCQHPIFWCDSGRLPGQCLGNPGCVLGAPWSTLAHPGPVVWANWGSAAGQTWVGGCRPIVLVGVGLGCLVTPALMYFGIGVPKYRNASSHGIGRPDLACGQGSS
jgi:hypothetical protein